MRWIAGEIDDPYCGHALIDTLSMSSFEGRTEDIIQVPSLFGGVTISEVSWPGWRLSRGSGEVVRRSSERKQPLDSVYEFVEKL